MQGGFGGKTMFALTGTSNEWYKQQLAPLYRHVQYVSPFEANSVEQLAEICNNQRVAVVQLELVQGVGGVRELPSHFAKAIRTLRQQHGFRVVCRLKCKRACIEQDHLFDRLSGGLNQMY